MSSEKKNRTEEFVKTFFDAVEALKKCNSLPEITMVGDAKFGYLVRSFGKMDVMPYLAQLAAAELRLLDFVEEQITKKKEELEKSYSEFNSDLDKSDQDEPVNVIPLKKKDLN